MKVFVDGLPRALLILVTMDPKFFSYSDLASAANSSTTCFVVRAWTTHSLPALTLGRTRALRRSEEERDLLQRRLVLEERLVGTISSNDDVAEVEDGRQDTEEIELLVCGESNRVESVLGVEQVSLELGLLLRPTHLHQSPLELVVHPSDLALGVLQVLVVGSVARQQ
jgi:hypothetical protein